ncbi:acyl carrier protein [Arcticibacter tournemirensis]|uniref:Acyl carrier protein n=1 Tax=Arcticibacter tournemirensis TaxID=699437 RepID=A0A5M9HCE6_9SPHI|nr:acyl carrier protein [Arcticibacter tournemirensis]KAA8482918.1 acyl carrier protein [Arcticibacter tournemirensis]TQM49698.1 acyl carrier protein [Arcticibacter tournemirensis]
MKNKIRTILSEVSGLPESNFADEARDFTAAEIDSMEMMEVIVKIEDVFNTTIPESDIRKLTSIRRIEKYLRDIGISSF